MTTPVLLEAWGDPKTTDNTVRDSIRLALFERERAAETDADRDATWPSAAMAERDEMAGLYPDPADPQFAARLFKKREFYEARAVATGVADGSIDPCTSAAAEAVFELTPVQRIVSRFMHPMTPYQGMLLFHGVGVGKTCSAVTIAEQFLEEAPTSKVIVLVPQALKENFKRTIFDPSKLEWSDTERIWKTRQCTGTSYLERLDMLDNPDIRAVTFKTEEDRRNRYTITGYQAFANWIDRTLKKSVPAGLTDKAMRRTAEDEVLRRLFSDRLIIVDEAHNLRDVGSGSADAVTTGEAAENQGGKALNPFLRRIVLNAEGLRLVLMTATPMYNSAPEILLLLSYLLMNDTKNEKAEMLPSKFFTKDGEIISGVPQQRLELAARRYVSYMRGENPYTFPLRMRPTVAAAAPAALWPTVSATKKDMVLTENDIAAINAMPLVFTEPVAGSPVEMQLRSATSRGGTGEEVVGDAMLDLRMQMANITYPNSTYGTEGFDYHFAQKTIPGVGHKLRVFAPKAFDVDSVFAGDALRIHAPKIHRIVESVKNAKGICFSYSRYIKAGALPLAIALERAGFQRRLADGRLAPLLMGVPAATPICAVCSSNESTHPADHPFKPACYVLLTSEDDISPNFAGLVRQATSWSADPENGPLGTNVKVILGSQVASEGLDLKCIREMHILDSWYHLNRTDQIIGRAIRYCSHTALRAVEERQGLPPMAFNNCLIYLHVCHVPETAAGPAIETADMYAYRIAIGKAQMVGKVQRLLKRHAWDCNLELEAITFAGLDPRFQQDAQGKERRSLDKDGNELEGYSINDQDFTTYCDYQVCRHECAITLASEGLHLDTSTFGVGDARRLILAKQSAVRLLFKDQVMIPESVVQGIFSDLPWEIASEALMELLDGRRFKLTRPDGVRGFLVAKAGYLVFQPEHVTDSDIPISLRYARAFQLRRHVMDSRLPVFGRSEEAGPVASIVDRPSSKLSVVAAEAGVGRWAEWAAFVERNGEGDIPKSIPSTSHLWSWVLQRCASSKVVALRWWFDMVASYTEQRSLLESAATDESDAALAETVGSDIYRSSSLIGYRIFNPLKSEIEYFCKSNAGGAWGPCASNIVAIIEKHLGNQPVTKTEWLYGFIGVKDDKIAFKTFLTDPDKEKDKKKKQKHSSIGAVCSIISTLKEHYLRVKPLLNAAEKYDILRPIVLPFSEMTWDKVGAKKRMAALAPEHIRDITHLPLCLYIEILTRLLDIAARDDDGRRWFLSAIEAAHSGLKGKK